MNVFWTGWDGVTVWRRWRDWSWSRPDNFARISSTKVRTDLETELWSLEFLSFHKEYNTAWKIILQIDLSLAFHDDVWTHWKFSLREGGGNRVGWLKKKDQISVEKMQSNKRWVKLSSATPQRSQSREIFKPQLLNRSFVGRRSRAIINFKKTCLRI